MRSHPIARKTHWLACTVLFASTHALADGQRLSSPRVVNGTLSQDHPSVGALLSPGSASSGGSHCSGTMIGCDTFLTAAHCVCDDTGADCQGANAPNPASYIVYLQHAGFHSIASIAVHPDYDFPIADVAVVKLAAPVTGIRPRPINRMARPATGTSAKIVGFGRTGGSASDYGIKRQGDVAISPCTGGVSNVTSVCWAFENPLGPPGTDSNTCNGDSGGPLFVDYGCGPVVAGITSGGDSGSCLPTDNSYDTDVKYYQAFIEAEGGADLNNAACGAMPQAGEAGATISGVVGALDGTTTEATHSFNVPAGATTLRIALNGEDNGSADFDLYVRQGSAPTTSTYDCAATTSSQYSYCEIASPAPGIWYVLAHRFSGSGTYQVAATSFAPGSPGPGTEGQTCNDANACTSGDTCTLGECSGSSIPDGTSCDDGTGCTSSDQCLAGNCAGVAAPAPACLTHTAGNGGSLAIRAPSSPSGSPSLRWTWKRSSGTSLAAFGDPAASAEYELCMYDYVAGLPTRVIGERIPAGSLWTATSSGYRYRDRDTTHFGLSTAQLRSSSTGRGSISVYAKGPSFPVPALPLQQQSEVVVQLVGPGACFEARYSSASRNEATSFRARAD